MLQKCEKKVKKINKIKKIKSFERGKKEHNMKCIRRDTKLYLREIVKAK